MRNIVFIAVLLLSACSYSEETAQVDVTVDGIPAGADHLDVVVTPSDTSVTGRNCSSALTPAPPSNATCYRPSFQPGALATGSLVLDFAAPSAAGTFTVDISASDRTQTSLAQGSVSGTLPGPSDLQVTLH
jgi:hypothetical protein